MNTNDAFSPSIFILYLYIQRWILHAPTSNLGYIDFVHFREHTFIRVTEYMENIIIRTIKS